MKKLLVSLIALSVVSFGAAAYAGPLSDALNNAANTVSKKEQAVTKAKKDIKSQQEQARKDAQARQAANQKELQKKKDAWNTLIGK